MDDMVGIASALPALGPETAARLEKALGATDVSTPDMAAQAALLAKRDALLALAASGPELRA
jgi:beta-N-acetylhexosaminidase